MKYILAIFTTRRDAIAYLDRLRSARIAAKIVNTPREVSISCGISVKFEPEALKMVKSTAYNYYSFVAFYLVEERYNKHIITLI